MNKAKLKWIVLIIIFSGVYILYHQTIFIGVDIHTKASNEFKITYIDSDSLEHVFYENGENSFLIKTRNGQNRTISLYEKSWLTKEYYKFGEIAIIDSINNETKYYFEIYWCEGIKYYSFETDNQVINKSLKPTKRHINKIDKSFCW